MMMEVPVALQGDQPCDKLLDLGIVEHGCPIIDPAAKDVELESPESGKMGLEEELILKQPASEAGEAVLKGGTHPEEKPRFLFKDTTASPAIGPTTDSYKKPALRTISNPEKAASRANSVANLCAKVQSLDKVPPALLVPETPLDAGPTSKTAGKKKALRTTSTPQRTVTRAHSGTNLRDAFATQKRPSSRRLLKPDDSTPIVRQPSRRCLQMLQRANSAPNLFDMNDDSDNNTNKNFTSSSSRRETLQEQKKRGSQRNISRKKSSRSPRRTGRRRQQRQPQQEQSLDDLEDPATYSRRNELPTKSASCRSMSDTVPRSPVRRNLYERDEEGGNNDRTPRSQSLARRDGRQNRSNSISSRGDTSLANARQPRRNSRCPSIASASNDSKSLGNARQPRRTSLCSTSSTISRWENPEGAQSDDISPKAPRRPSMVDDSTPRPPSRASSPSKDDDSSLQQQGTAVISNRGRGPNLQTQGTAVASNRSFRSTASRDAPKMPTRRSDDDDDDDNDGFPSTITTDTRGLRRPTSTYRISADQEPEHPKIDISLLGYMDSDEAEKEKFLPRRQTSRKSRSRHRGSMDSRASIESMASRMSKGSFYSTGGMSAKAQFQSRRTSMGARQLPSRAKSHCDQLTAGTSLHGDGKRRKRLRISKSTDARLGIVPAHDQQQQRRHSGSKQQRSRNSFAGVVLGRHSRSFHLHCGLNGSDHKQRERQRFRRARSMDIKPSQIRRAPSPPAVDDGVESVASFGCDVSGIMSAFDQDDEAEIAVFDNNSDSSDDLTGSLRSGSLRSGSLATRSFKSVRSFGSMYSSKSRNSRSVRSPKRAAAAATTVVEQKAPSNIADLVENMDNEEGEYIIFIGDKKDLARVKGQNNGNGNEDDVDSDDADDNSTYNIGGGGGMSFTGSRGSVGSLGGCSLHNSLTNMDLSLGSMGSLGKDDAVPDAQLGNQRRRSKDGDGDDYNDDNVDDKVEFAEIIEGKTDIDCGDNDVQQTGDSDDKADTLTMKAGTEKGDVAAADGGGDNDDASCRSSSSSDSGSSSSSSSCSTAS